MNAERMWGIEFDGMFYNVCQQNKSVAAKYFRALRVQVAKVLACLCSAYSIVCHSNIVDLLLTDTRI